jgi:hypothetical protein
MSAHELPLRDQCRNAEHLIQKLIDHVEKGFLPKARKLKELLEEAAADEETVEDVTIRSHATAVLESEQFSARLCDEVGAYFESIDQALRTAIEGP